MSSHRAEPPTCSRRQPLASCSEAAASRLSSISPRYSVPCIPRYEGGPRVTAATASLSPPFQLSEGRAQSRPEDSLECSHNGWARRVRGQTKTFSLTACRLRESSRETKGGEATQVMPRRRSPEPWLADRVDLSSGPGAASVRPLPEPSSRRRVLTTPHALPSCCHLKFEVK